MRHLKELAAIQAFVSIHASVKDATVTIFLFKYLNTVSIHASVKDATYETKFQIFEP